jgi:hypothetical protein
VWRVRVSPGVRIERRAGSVSIPQEAFIAALRMGEEGLTSRAVSPNLPPLKCLSAV